jgi:hypothetical protein
VSLFSRVFSLQKGDGSLQRIKPVITMAGWQRRNIYIAGRTIFTAPGRLKPVLQKHNSFIYSNL